MGELEHEKRDHWIDQISTEEGVLDSTAGPWKEEEDEEVDHAKETTTLRDKGGQVFGDNAQFYNPLSHSEYEISKSVQFVVRTNIGAECYCAAEIEEVLDSEQYYCLARPFGIAG